MEELNEITFSPENKKLNITQDTINLDFNESFDGFKIDDEEDIKVLVKMLDTTNKKDIENENKNMSKLEKTFMEKIPKKVKNKVPSTKLTFDEDILSPKLIDFFMRAYNIISEKNYDQIDNYDEEDNKKEINYLLNLIDQIILEDKNNNCKMSIVYCKNKEKSFNNRYFTFNVYVLHKILKFNDLLNLTIIFKVKIEMAVRSGNVNLSFTKCSIDYNDKAQEVIINPNLNCLLINNNLGNYSITYCTCGDCMKCRNRKEPKPFDDVLYYLKKENGIKTQIYTSLLWFGKFNKYRNESGYKCSFCTDFYRKKLNIVKLFCNGDFDSDHTCQFWICRDCYWEKSKKRTDEICPNCGKFFINFSKLYRMFRYLRWKKNN